MDHRHHTIRLYSPQAAVVRETVEQEGTAYSKRAYVAKKYEESAPIFLAAYDWFVKELPKYLPKPEGAEYPYWAFLDPKNVDQSVGNPTLILDVPVNEAVYFDLYDWSKILCLQYIGENEADEKAFRQMLKEYGVRKESDVILTNFYPDLKRQVMDSWTRLFRFDAAVKDGTYRDFRTMQAGLWWLKREWIQ